MTRLNYVNRKSSGLKLGQIVQKDLNKRLTASSSKYDSSSPLELSLEGKDLTDAGIEAFAATLARILTPGETAVVSRLQILHLQNNGLTTRSLALLAPAIRAASADLEDLDLSNNAITITTPDDVTAWESFLFSFQDCRALRRVSLAGNDLSNVVALDIFSRTYMLQCSRNASVFLTAADDDDLLDDDARALDRNMNALAVRDSNIPVEEPSANGKNSTTLVKVVKGLPGIQIIDLSDASMTDAGALFLSRVIERHRWVQSAVYRRPWGAPALGSDYAKILISGNNKMATTATKMLAHAEASAYRPFEAQDETDQLTNAWKQDDILLNDSRRTSGASAHLRRVSDFSTASDSHNGSSGIANIASQELESLQRRLQRSTIEDHGVTNIRLWVTSITLLLYVRHTMFIHDQDNVVRWDPESTYANAAAQQLPLADDMDRRRRTSSVSSGGRSSRESGSLGINAMTPSYASKLLTSRAGSHAPSPSPRTPQVLRAPRVRDRKDSHTASRAERSDSGVGTPEINQTMQIRERMTIQRPQMIGPLPVEAWCEVLFFLADPDHVLSDRQRRQVVEYGKSRRSLRQEIEVLGKARSAQVWLVLDKMGCLMYDDVE